MTPNILAVQRQVARLIASTTFLFCTCVISHAQLAGADLNYTTVDQKLEITLTCYYDCAFEQIPQTEYTSVVETMAKGAQQYVSLNQDEIEEVSSTNTAPCKDLNTCLKRVTYVASVPVNQVPGGYDITWIHHLNQSFLNLGAIDGISLTTHVGEMAISDGNASPKILEAPTVKGCSGFENSSLLKAIDLSHPDSCRVEFASVATAYSEFDPSAEHKVGPEGMEAIPFPPFKSADYVAAYSSSQPFGNEKIEIDTKNNLLKFEPNQAGKYLLAFTVYDIRNGKEIGTSQRIFITDLK